MVMMLAIGTRQRQGDLRRPLWSKDHPEAICPRHDDTIYEVQSSIAARPGYRLSDYRL
jgi:hypothetical protein